MSWAGCVVCSWWEAEAYIIGIILGLPSVISVSCRKRPPAHLVTSCCFLLWETVNTKRKHHWYFESLSLRVFSNRCKALLFFKVIWDRSWNIIIMLPLKVRASFCLTLAPTSSFRAKFWKQHRMSWGGAVSGPLALRALWACTNSIVASTWCSRMLLNIFCRACGICSGVIDSGTALILRFLRLPLLSRSSKCLLISVLRVCGSDLFQSFDCPLPVSACLFSCRDLFR